MEGIGLVLEGGGLRAIYTAGVLDFFLEKKLEFNYGVGVSAGAIYPASYVSKQRERNIQVQLRYLNDKRYMGLEYLIKTGSYINNDFTYRKMSYELLPFDFEAFMKSKMDFKTGAFNCLTGETDYFSKNDFLTREHLVETLIASGSLPFISKQVLINNTPYLDGGIGAPIPISKSIEDGNNKNVVILTQDDSYKKQPFKFKKIINVFYRKYPRVSEALLNRHNVYNESVEKVKKAWETGDVYLIRPSRKVNVSRLEKDLDKIKELYNLGIEDAKFHYPKLIPWLENNKKN
jgi:predicted patatin/cPLA2 family phospholipase